MGFRIELPKMNGTDFNYELGFGEHLFVVGANGTGKSSLLQWCYKLAGEHARFVTAHRQNWMESSEIQLSPLQKNNIERDLYNHRRMDEGRWKEPNSVHGSSIALVNLMNSHFARALRISDALDDKDFELAKDLSAQPSVLKVVNSLLKQVSIPVQIDFEGSERLIARRDGGVVYGAAELSDGERNAILMAATVLTFPPNILILLDEPERHLHRSIISPLLTMLFQHRSDCSFIIATHEIMLPIECPRSRTLLVRECRYDQGRAASWDIDLLEPGHEIEEDTIRAIIGGRRKILFVEGRESSLDRALYQILFPDRTVIPKSSCRDVEQAVEGIKGTERFHWLDVIGIVDRDTRSGQDAVALRKNGILVLPFYSIEAVYYHPIVQEIVAKRQEIITGNDAHEALDASLHSSLRAISDKVKSLAERVAEGDVRREFFRKLPNRKSISSRVPIDLNLDVASMVSAEEAHLVALIGAKDFDGILVRYPIRESTALDSIAKEIGFQDRRQYEKAVRHTLSHDPDALAKVKTLIGDMPEL